MNEKQKKLVRLCASMCHDTLLGHGVDADTFISNLQMMAKQMEGLETERVAKSALQKASEKHLDKEPSEPLPELIDIPSSSPNLCSTCGEAEGEQRFDNGLPAGCHCQGCWDKMVSDCRSRSW